MIATLGEGDKSNTLFYRRDILLKRQLGNLQRTFGMLLRQSKPFGIISHTQRQCEAGGEVVVR